MNKPLLSINRLSVRYGATPALQGVDLLVHEGEVACVVGQNGAGKSTLLAAIAGALPAQICQGGIHYRGWSLIGKKPEDIARAGISLAPEGRHVFSDMTVKENLLIGTYMRTDRRQVWQEVESVLELFPRLRERLNYPAGLLSGGEQQMLVIGRGVLTNADLMLIDEPSLGLAPKVVSDVYRVLLTLREQRGLTLLINEQSSNRVIKYADTIHVLRGGKMRLTASAEDMADGHALRSAYFGLEQPSQPASVVL